MFLHCVLLFFQILQPLSHLIFPVPLHSARKFWVNNNNLSLNVWLAPHYCEWNVYCTELTSNPYWHKYRAIIFSRLSCKWSLRSSNLYVPVHAFPLRSRTLPYPPSPSPIHSVKHPRSVPLFRVHRAFRVRSLLSIRPLRELRDLLYVFPYVPRYVPFFHSLSVQGGQAYDREKFSLEMFSLVWNSKFDWIQLAVPLLVKFVIDVLFTKTIC